MESIYIVTCSLFFFFQAEDGIRDLVRSRGLGDVYKRQTLSPKTAEAALLPAAPAGEPAATETPVEQAHWTLSLIHI